MKGFSRALNNRQATLALLVSGLGLVLLGVAGFFVIPQAAATPEAPSAVPVAVNFPAPELNLHDLQGQAVKLSDWRGQVALVNNWATWCPPCKAEMPVLQAYYDAHKDQDFTLIAIEGGEPAAEVAEFARSYRLTFPVWVDEKSAALDAFQNWDIPSSYLVDREGVVRLTWVGPVTRQTLEKYVTPFLE